MGSGIILGASTARLPIAVKLSGVYFPAYNHNLTAYYVTMPLVTWGYDLRDIICNFQADALKRKVYTVDVLNKKMTVVLDLEIELLKGEINITVMKIISKTG